MYHEASLRGLSRTPREKPLFGRKPSGRRHSWWKTLVILTLLTGIVRFCHSRSSTTREPPGSCLASWILSNSVDEECTIGEAYLDVVYVWTNGSDATYARERQRYAMQSVRTARASGRRKLERMTKHQREHGELFHSISSVQQYLHPSAIYVLCSDFVVDQFVYLVKPAIDLDIFQLVGTRQIMPKKSLPVFNSLSIENYLHEIPSLAEYVLYLNDDMLLCRRHSRSDFFNPLTGPAFHISRDILVRDAEPDELEEYWDSEWSSLQYTNLLLSQRFGNRSRGYVEHIGKVFSRKLMTEVFEAFRTQIEGSLQYKFREGNQVNMLFLTTWYTIEMNKLILVDLLFAHHLPTISGDISNIVSDDRSPEASDFGSILRMMHIEPPSASRIVWTYMDGYPSDYTSVSTSQAHCSLLNECYKYDGVKSHLMEVPNRPCGDCLLSKFGTRTTIRSTLRSLSPELRRGYIADLGRYAYSVSETSIEFLNLVLPETMDIDFGRVRDNRPAQLCVNEDAASDNLTRIELLDAGIRTFLASMHE